MRRAIGDNSMQMIKRLMAVNLGLAALQPISAGFFLSGFNHALAVHIAGAVALQVVVVIQCVAAIVLRLRHRLSARVTGLCVGLLVMIMLEVWAGRHRQYWVHVPIGVGIFAWLRGRMNELSA